MKRMNPILPVLIGAAFCIGLLEGVRWSVEPMLRPPQGLHSGSDADLIRDRYPNSIVNPSALGVADDEVLGRWVGAEVRARVKVVSVSLGLLVTVAVTVAYLVGKRRTANQAVHAIGASAPQHDD